MKVGAWLPVLNNAVVLICLFLLALLLVNRVVFALLFALGFWLVAIIVSRAKFKALREPLVFSDFALFSQVFRHPRLYLPFLPPVLSSLFVIAAGILIYVLLRFEPVLWDGVTARFLSAGVIGLILWGGWRYFKLVAGRVRFQPDPAQAILQHGFLGNLLVGFIQAQGALGSEHFWAGLHAASPFKPPGQEADKLIDLPDIVLVQSESFFDARRLPTPVSAAVLENFDRIRESSCFHGRLSVPAWGANTMRTEFAVLTGLESAALEQHGYYPYQYLHKNTLPSLVQNLRALGYRCVCIHPHPMTFFRRDRIFPRLGFDRFLDIRDFNAAGKFGPYVSDAAVSAKIIEQLRAQTRQPLFVFAITMENHGPLHLESVTEAEKGAFLGADSALENAHDLAVYLRHLANADAMLAELTEYLSNRQREGVVCFYGDHVPSMPHVYAELAYADGSTDYLVWRGGGRKGSRNDIQAHELGRLLFEAARIPLPI